MSLFASFSVRVNLNLRRKTHNNPIVENECAIWNFPANNPQFRFRPMIIGTNVIKRTGVPNYDSIIPNGYEIFLYLLRRWPKRFGSSDFICSS